MIKPAIIAFWALVIFSFVACTPRLKMQIDRNKVASDVTIKVLDKNLTLKPNEFFTLSETGLEANGGPIDAQLLELTKIDVALKAFKKKKYVSYDVLINNAKYSKPYYGKIAFFNASKSNATSAVTRYREITIDNNYFESATRGRVAIMYEYALYNGFSAWKTPTWVLLMSDEPL
jgi:hypothetical protein